MKPLQTVSVAAPGFFGLNTQEAATTLEVGYALEANNAVIDRDGRLASRKGWEYSTTSGGTSTNLVGGHEFIDVDGTRTVITWSDNTFYTGVATLATPTDNSTVFATANFDASTLNDKAFFCQAGDEIRYYDGATGAIENISTSGTAGSNPAGIAGANCCLSAYGRLWVADTTTSKTTVYWSNLLDGTNFGTGSAGSIDLSAVLVRGNDEIVALGAHNGRLIIFCKDNVVIYGDTDADQVLDPANMRLVEVINGVGCVSRDSVQNTGQDIIFFSRTGLRGLSRVIQEKSQPMRDLSKNVRDELVRAATSSADYTAIQSVYVPTEAFYLLRIPAYNTVYCFDTRTLLQDGSARVTTWTNQTQNNFFQVDDELYFCQTDGLGMYSSYQDNGAPYRFSYFTSYFDFQDPTKVKYVKRVAATVIGGGQETVIFKVGSDYTGDYRSFSAELTGTAPAEYGVAEYGIAEYTTGVLTDNLRVPIGGSGNVIQVGIEAEIDGFELSLQRLDLYIKMGRVY